MSKQYIPPADLLLKQYLRLAQSFTDRAAPQDNVLALITSDCRYERALLGIRLLARHHLGHTVNSLIEWREHVSDDVKKNYSQNNVVNVPGTCKRAAMEILFLQGAMQVLDAFEPEFWKDRNFQTFFQSMQNVSFRWLLNSEDYVPYPELTQIRQHVVLISGRVVGALSRIRLLDVCTQFVKKLEERVQVRKDINPRTDPALARSQALRLCAGMRNIELTFDTDEQLVQSTRFLQKVHPLHYTTAVKKSQIHHALCEMLTDILTPLVFQNKPHSCSGLNQELLADWHQQILKLKNDIGQWANKHNKHILVGYPLVTVLVCLVDDKNYNSLVDSMADFLAKQMKNKDYRSLCFKCLNQLVISSLVRNARAASKPQVVAWLDKIVKPGLVNARKGGISMQEQQDFVADIADLNPEYCVGNVVTDLLQADSLEAQLVALRTLYLVATSVPHNSAAAIGLDSSVPSSSKEVAASLSSFNASSTRQMVQLSTTEILDLIRSSQHPFELQGIAHLLPRVQQQIAQLLLQQHRTFGAYLAYSADQIPKDKHPQLPHLCAVIRLVPLLKPEQWDSVLPLDLLPSYTAHADNNVRTAAVDALMSIICGCPALRGTVLINMTAFTGSIPDEAASTTHGCLLVLRSLMVSWLSLIQEQRLTNSSLCSSRNESKQHGSSQMAGELSSPACKLGQGETAKASASASITSLVLDVHRLEGILFMLFCSCSESVRCDAYGLLGLLRTLHQQLCDMAQPLTGDPRSEPPAGSSAADTKQATAAAGAGASSFWSNASASENKVASSRCNIQPSGSAGSSTSVEVIRQHKPTISNDSMDFMLTLGQFEVPDAGSTSIMDILEEVGDDVVHQCYWDFGDWSDLWRETKHVPLGVNLQDVMTASDEVGKLRWMRCLVELARTACHMCPTSMGVAYLEMLHKLSRCLTRDAMGRLQIPADSEVRRAEAWRAFMVVACVCPPSLREHAEKAAARKGTNLTARELIRALLAALAGGSSVHQQVCLMALGHVSPEHYPVLFDELAGCMDEYQKPGKQKKGAARPEEGRKMVANVMRLVADTMPQGTLAQQTLVRSRYLDWLRDTVAYLRSLPPFGEAFWDVCQVAYCLCAVCRSIAGPISNQLNQSLAQLRESAVQRSTSNKSTASDSSTAASSGQAAAGDTGGSQHPAVGTAGQPMTRKLLFEMFMLWCEEGQGKGTEYYNRLNAGINAALARLKDYDTDTRESLKQEMTQSAELLDQASRLAMAAMLQGPAFDPDARRAQGPVLYWIDRLLKAPSLGVSAGRTPCVPKDSVGRTALFNLLCSNLDMFSICVDRCYDRDLRIATGSFQVVSEVYALNAVKVEPHVVLSLVLYKMVDSCPEVREDALHMLHVLSTREWHTTGASLTAAAAAGLSGAADEWKAQQQQLEEAFTLEAEGGSGTVVVLGALQDSYQQFQFQLASKLARDHPELSEALCEEMMTRQLELADKVSQHPVLTCLGPWMENLTILTHWKGTWCERLLKSMYYVTLRHGDELPSEIENLWSRLANTRRNIIPILDFLASLGTHMAYQGMGAMLEYLSVGKRICLYLARVGAQQTIDHLVYEISLQLHEEETAAPAAARDHQLLSSNSQEQAAPLQFTAVYTLPPSVPSTRFPPQQQSAVAEAPGLLRSSASSWWAYSSTSSLGSSTAATPSAQIPSSSSIAASTGPSSSTGLLGSMLGLAGSMQGAVASSHTPGLNQHGSINTAVSPTDAALTPRGVKTGTMSGSGIIGSSVPTSAPSAGMGDSREGVAAVQGTVPRSMTEHSDSTRSSLSLTGQGSTAGLVGAPDQGAGSLFAAADGSLTAPRPVAVGAKAGVLSASSDLPSSANTAAASTSSLKLGGYSGTPHSAAAAGVTNHTAAGSLAQDTPASWPGGDEGRQNIPSQEDAEPGSPGLRGLVTRPELALCLLTEVAYEHDEDFSSHLALLCHVSLLLVDHEEQLVAAAAQQLLINCLYSISARHLEMMQEQGQQVECLQATHLIKYLQSMRGRRLWPYEDLTLGQQQQLSSAIALAGLVQHCLHALSFEGELQSSWCSVAFEWALHAHNGHLACRSQQVVFTVSECGTCGDLVRSTDQQPCIGVASAQGLAGQITGREISCRVETWQLSNAYGIVEVA